MKTARTFNGLSTQIFLWFWFMLLLVVAAVVIPAHPGSPQHHSAAGPRGHPPINNNLAALQKRSGSRPGLRSGQGHRCRRPAAGGQHLSARCQGQMQSSTRLSKFVIRFMLDSGQPGQTHAGQRASTRHRGSLPDDPSRPEPSYVYFWPQRRKTLPVPFIQILTTLPSRSPASLRWSAPLPLPAAGSAL